jgi:ribonuclease P protein component
MHASKEQLKNLDRLKKRSDFLSVQDRVNKGQGGKWVSKSLILQAAPGDRQSQRFGITVSKKTSKSAVVRNRIKRRLRAAARDVLPQKARDGLDFVLIGRADAETKAYADIVNDLAWCVKRLGYGRDRAPDGGADGEKAGI